MKESTSVACIPGPSSSSAGNMDEQQVKGPKYMESCSSSPAGSFQESGGDVSKSSTREFDDSCFKTPLLPVKKTPNYQSKKKQARTNGQLKARSGGDANNTVPSLSQLSICGSSQGSSRQPKKADDHPELLDQFVSIGKHAFLCPHSRQYIACQFPNLPQKRPSNPEEDLVKEIVIDEFSLLLFASLEDYNLLKMHEDEQKEREDNEQKRKINEENLRLGKVKKKGRKSKIDLEKERKALKKKAKEERKELKRQRHEQKAVKRREEREHHHSQLTPQQREERRREKREQRNNNTSKLPNGQPKTPKLSKEAKQKQKEEQSRLKKENKLELKKQKRLASKVSSGAAAAAAVHPAAIDPAAACTSSSDMATAVALNSHPVPTGEPVDWRSITEIANKQAAASSPAAGKRPASSIGIASPQRNGGVILGSPTTDNHTANTPPATKIRKVSCQDTELAGVAAPTTPEDSKALIGIAGACKPEDNQHTNTLHKLEENSKSSKTVCAGGQPSTSSRPATSTPIEQAAEPLASLQQASLNNPEFAKNYHQSIASLRAVDASLMGIAAAAGGAAGGFPFYTSPQFLQQLEQQQRLNAAARPPKAEVPAKQVPFLQQQPAVALASQLAGVAALANKNPFLNSSTPANSVAQPSANTSTPISTVNTRPKQKSRWCCMHVTIAHEIARHIEASKNSSSKAGDAKAVHQQLHLQQQQQGFSAALNNNNNNSAAAAISKASSQQHKLQRVHGNNISSSSSAKTMQHQQQQQQQQQFSNHNSTQLQQQQRQRGTTAGPSMPKQSSLGDPSQFSFMQQQQHPLMFATGGSTSSSSKPGGAPTAQQPPNHKLPPILANGVPSSLAAAQQLSALGFPLAAPQFGVSGSLTSGTSAQAASINAALGQNPATNAQQMALQLAMLSQLGLNLPPGGILGPPAPSFNLQPSSYANPLTSLLTSTSNAAAGANRLLNNNPATLHNSQAEATQNALLQAALLQSIQSLENKAAMQQQQAQPPNMDLMRQQQQLMEQSAVMQQHQQLLERFHANNHNQHASSLLLQHQQQQQQQQALHNGLLFGNPIDQEMMMRQRLFAQLRPDGVPSSSSSASTPSAPLVSKGGAASNNRPPTAQQGSMEAIMAEFARQQQLAANAGASNTNMFNSLAVAAANQQQQQQSINNFGGAANSRAT